MSVEKKIKKIDKRSWSEIKDLWVDSNIPSIDPPGSAPEYQISEIPEISSIISNVSNQGEHKEDNVAGLKAAVIHEGIFLFLKAINVCGTTELNIGNGFHTWSISSAYHSSFFSMKSLLCLLGITIPQVQGNNYVIDIWPSPEKISKNQWRKGIEPSRKIKFLKISNLPHFRVWKILQRVFSTTNFDNSIDKEIIGFLISIDPKSFAQQRNNIHYQNNHWLLEDLMEPREEPNFGVIRGSLISEIGELKVGNDDFTVCIAFILLKINHMLFEELSNDAPILKPQLEVINQSMELVCGDIYKTYQ